MAQTALRKMRVTELAEHSNMSLTTFREQFRSITGTSPVQFQKMSNAPNSDTFNPRKSGRWRLVKSVLMSGDDCDQLIRGDVGAKSTHGSDFRRPNGFIHLHLVFDESLALLGA